MAKWQAWIGDLGSAMVNVNPGTPLGPAKTLRENGVSDDGRSDPLTGFSIVRADSMEAAAMAIAQDCPFLKLGTIRVSEVMDMKMK